MIRLTERGSKLGIHAQKTLFFDHLRQAAAQGTPFPAVKLTQEQTALADVKRDSPDTLTVARVPHEHDALEGIADEPRMTEARAAEWAAVIMGHAFRYLELNPDLVQHIDVYELVNESDPNTVDGWYNLGAVMRQCVRLGRTRYPTIAWGIGSFNFGTPEYIEAQAFIESGVLEEVAHGDVVLCVHEGTRRPEDPIDDGYGNLIPGAPVLPDNAGAFFGRVAYFAYLAGDRMPPVIVSEAYVHAYDDVAEARRRAEWVDDLYSKLWYVVAWLPFTHSPTSAWRHQDYTPAYPGLIEYAGQVRDRANATRPEPEPEPDPVDWRRAVWEASLEEQQARGITLNPEHGLERLVYARPGYQVVHREITHRTPDGAAYGLMAAEHLGGADPRIVLVFERPWSGAGNVQTLTEADVPEPEPLPFAWRAWPTDYRVITQTVGNNPAYYGKIAPDFEGHEGLDIRAPMGAPVYSVDDGVVSDMRQLGDKNHPYGRFVRVRYEGGHEVTYAHLNSIAVSVGEQVTAGQVIAHADNTGNIVQGSSHLHVTLKRDGVIVDPTPFILPWKPNFPGLPPAAHGLTTCDVSHYQNKKDEDDKVVAPVDFSAMMRRGVYGCYVRGSIGKTGEDIAFERNWNAIAGTPLKRGMYHLWIAQGLRAEDNLENIIRMVNTYGNGDFRISIDVEPVRGNRIDGNEVARFLNLFREAFGYDPIVYTGNWVVNSWIDGDITWLLRTKLWLASYWNVVPQVGQYPSMPLGAPLSNLMGHQWTSSYFDGRKWGVESFGLDVNVVYDLDRLLVTGDAPEPPPPPPPAPKLDLLPYFDPEPGGNGPLFELRRPDGSQERVQHQSDPRSNKFYITKGTGGLQGKSEYEELAADADWIWRGLDTSPGGGRYYRQFEEGRQLARWCPRRMAIGETWVGPGHRVQFYTKANCQPSEPNSGPATNRVTLVARHASRTWNGVTVQDVIELTNDTERWWFARGIGMVAWSAPWGQSAISELHAAGTRPDNVRETGCFD